MPDKHRALTSARVITTDGQIILVDESLSPTTQTELQGLQTINEKELLFLDDRDLAKDLEKVLVKILKSEPRSLLVFPGNGSNYPRKLSPACQGFQATAGVFAKRTWIPGCSPVVTTGLIIPKIFMMLGVKSLIVVDDVVSSGLTMRKLYQNNAWRFPGARWKGVAWIAQTPQSSAQSGVRGYDSLSVGCLVGKTDGSRVPVNSLSTFRRNPEIAESYASRHFRKPEEFLHLIRKQ